MSSVNISVIYDAATPCCGFSYRCCLVHIQIGLHFILPKRWHGSRVARQSAPCTRLNTKKQQSRQYLNRSSCRLASSRSRYSDFPQVFAGCGESGGTQAFDPHNSDRYFRLHAWCIRSRPKLNYGAGRDFEVGPEFGATRKQPIIPGNSRARLCADEEDRVTWLNLWPG